MEGETVSEDRVVGLLEGEERLLMSCSVVGEERVLVVWRVGEQTLSLVFTDINRVASSS